MLKRDELADPRSCLNKAADGEMLSDFPRTLEEATCFYNGFVAGATTYALAVGHAGAKSENAVLKKLIDEEGWKTIERFEKLAKEPTP